MSLRVSAEVSLVPTRRRSSMRSEKDMSSSEPLVLICFISGRRCLRSRRAKMDIRAEIYCEAESIYRGRAGGVRHGARWKNALSRARAHLFASEGITEISTRQTITSPWERRWESEEADIVTRVCDKGRERGVQIESKGLHACIVPDFQSIMTLVHEVKWPVRKLTRSNRSDQICIIAGPPPTAAILPLR